MLIQLNLDGSVKAVAPSNIYQGSNGVTSIDVVAEFPPTTAMEIGFIKPDGFVSEYYPMSYSQSGVWSYILQGSQTEQFGELFIAINAIGTDGNTTSYMAKVIVQESLPPTPPPFPPEQNQWELILQYTQAAMAGADEAITTADGAVETANKAVVTANEAKATSENALGVANGIDAKATQALSNSQTAIATANGAVATSNQAVQTANQAKEVAEGIDGKANLALAKSDEAIGIANGAVADIATFKDEINASNAEYQAATTERVDELEQQIIEKQGTKVNIDGVLQAAINFTSDPQTQINDEVAARIAGDQKLQDNIDNLQAIRILNKGVITSTQANIQTTCTNYIQTEYERAPQHLDGLIVTVTDGTPENVKAQYMYSKYSEMWIDVGTSTIDIADASYTEKGLVKVLQGGGIQVNAGEISADGSVVRTSGDQAIAGNKTLSGTTAFTGNISVDGKAISPAELGYLDGATSNIQVQLNNKVTLDTAQNIAGQKNFNGGVLLNGTDLQAILDGKADKATTLAGYGIMNAYTKSEIDSKFAIVEKVDIVYDKNSFSSSVNWGYTSGIRSQVTVSGKSFSKYKHLRILYASKAVSNNQDSFGGNNIILLDLKTSSALGVYTCTVMNRYVRMELQYNSGIAVTINSAKSSIFVSFGDGGNIIPSSNTEYYIFKIEGVY